MAAQQSLLWHCLSFFLVLLCCRLMEEQSEPPKALTLPVIISPLITVRSLLSPIWIVGIILAKGSRWRASEDFHLHAASRGSSVEISLECSSSQWGSAGVKCSRMQSDRGAGRWSVTALVDWTLNLTRQSQAGRPVLLQSYSAVPNIMGINKQMRAGTWRCCVPMLWC